jgi:hypothetical protein
VRLFGLLRWACGAVLAQVVQLLWAQRTTGVVLLDCLPLLVEAGPWRRWNGLVEEHALLFLLDWLLWRRLLNLLRRTRLLLDLRLLHRLYWPLLNFWLLLYWPLLNLRLLRRRPLLNLRLLHGRRGSLLNWLRLLELLLPLLRRVLQNRVGLLALDLRLRWLRLCSPIDEGAGTHCCVLV